MATKKQGTGAGISKIVIVDGAGGRTTLDLTQRVFESVAMGRTIEDGVLVEGEGDVLTIDLSTVYMYGGDVIEFDPAPDATPIKLTFSTED